MGTSDQRSTIQEWRDFQKEWDSGTQRPLTAAEREAQFYSTGFMSAGDFEWARSAKHAKAQEAEGGGG